MESQLFDTNVWNNWWRHKPESCSAQQLLEILVDTSGQIVLPNDSFNQVFDDIYIGDQSIAENIDELKRLKISHVLNAAFGTDYTLNLVQVCPQLYSENIIVFLGIEAIDCSTFPLWKFFEKSVQFIEDCIESRGKVLVHCKQGISRSASLVIAYLMIKKHFSVIEAVRTVRAHRPINPNEGFLGQLCFLNDRLFNKQI